MTRHWTATLFAAVACLLASTPVADAADLDRSDAAKKALAAIDAREGDEALVVFGLRRTVREGARISQAGPAGAPLAPRQAQVPARLSRAGVDAVRSGKVMQADEASWLFYADHGPSLAFEHPGRIVLVGKASGKVRVSKKLRWIPLLDGRLPAFFRTPASYAAKGNRVFDRPWKVRAEAARAGATAKAKASVARTPAAAAAQQRLADALAAERSCALRVSDTLGDLYDYGRVDETRASLGRILRDLGRLNAGFVSERYSTRSGRTPAQAAQRLIDNDGCRDLLLYVAGSGVRNGQAGVVVGVRPRGSTQVQWHTLSAAAIERLVRANRNVTFKLVFDAPYSGRIASRLSDEPNVTVLITSGDADDPSFAFLPEILDGTVVLRNPTNPFRFLEFTNSIIGGLDSFTNLPEEIDHAIAERGAGRSNSVMAWMLARALDLGPSPFSARLLGRRNQRVPFTTPFARPPAAGGGSSSSKQNRAPNPTTPDTFVTAEDTARSIVLTATDPDGDPMSFEVTATTTQGTLSGTAPNLTYTPDQDFNGNDELTYRVTDNQGASASETVRIRVTPDNDRPAVVGGPILTPASYTEQDPPTEVDSALTVTDVDSTHLESATAAVHAGFVAGDELEADLTATPAITGTYDSGTGVLTLTGNATLADYQEALRSVTFASTSDDPGPSRTIRFTAFDGDEVGDPADRGISVTEENDAPENTVPGDQTTDEDTTLTLTDEFSVEDVDARSDAIEVTLSGTDGTISLDGTSGLNFTTGDGTSDATMTFTGSQGAINAAIDEVDFSPTANFTGTTGEIDLETDDQGNNGTGGPLTDTDTVEVDVDAVNDAPVNTLPAAGALDADEDDDATSTGFSISDVDAAGTDAMEVELEVVEGTLDVASGGTLTGDGTGTVKIEGTKDQVNTSLGSVTYEPDGNFNGGDTLTMTTSDLGHNPTSDPAGTDTDTFAIAVAAINDAPTLTKPGTQTIDEDNALTFTDGSATEISVADVDAGTDDVEVELAVSNGTLSDGGTPAASLTLTGSLTAVNAALDGLVYQPAANYSGSDTLEIDVDDLGNNGSGTGTLSDSVGITVSAVNDKPVVTTTSTGATTFTEGSAAGTVVVDSGVTVTDVEDNTISGATVKIDPGYRNEASPADHDTLSCTPQHGITCSFDAPSGTLNLSGTATTAQYQDVLRSVTFHNDSQNSAAAARTMTFKVTDTGTGTPTSDGDDRTVNVTRVNDKPVVTTNTGSATAYTENDAPTVVDSSVGVSDVDSTTLAGATATISSGHDASEDVLSATGGSGVTVVGYNSSTGVLTLGGTASVAAYDAALKSVRYANTSDDPSTATRTVSFQVDDGASENNLSDVASHDVTVAAVNDKPVVLTSAGATSFQEPTTGPPAPVVVDAGVQIGDPDSTLLNRVTVTVSAGHQTTDVLAYATNHGIEATGYDSGTGVLTLEPEGVATTASIADFEAAAREVTFATPSTSPGAGRTITFRARDDANAESDGPATAQKSITINNVNGAPTITNLSGTVAYAENSAAVQLDGDAEVTDPDGDDITGGTVTITNFQPGDELSFTDTGNVTGTYDDTTGVLTISGADDDTQYETFVRSVAYRTVDDTPNTDDRLIDFQVTDGVAASSIATKTVDVSATNDPSVVTTTAGPSSYVENASPTTVDGAVTVTDADDATLASASVVISNVQSGDVLHFSNTAEITGSYTAGSLTLSPVSGEPTVAQWQAALQSVTYSNATENPSETPRIINFSVNDGSDPSNTASKTMNVDAVNDAPVLTQPDSATLTYTEDSPGENHALAIAPNLGVTDGDDANLTGATVDFTAGYAGAQDTLAFVNTPEITGNYTGGVLTLSGTATVEQYRDALRSVGYRNTSDAPDTTQRTVRFQVTDGHTGENPTSNTVSRNIGVVATNDAPTADNEQFLNSAGKGAIGNTALVVDDNTDGAPALNHPKKSTTGDLLDGDQDPDGPNALQVVPVTNAATTDGGKVTIEADGDFVYVSDPADDCTNPDDTFQYTVTDGNTPTAGTATGTVTVEIAGCAWYVDNDPGKAGDAGTSTEPFNTLAQAESESAANHTVFVFDDDVSTVGLGTADGYQMASGERLIGQHAGLTIDPDQGGPLGTETLHPATDNAHPTLSATLGNVVELAPNNEVRGIAIDPQGASSGITGLSGDINSRIDGVKIVDTGVVATEPALELSGTTGGTGHNISDLTIDNTGAATTPPSTAKGIVLNGAGVVNFQSAGTISVTTEGAAALDADTTSMGTGSVFDDITVTDSSSGGIRLFNTSGTTQLGSGSGTDLNLTTTSGAAAAMLLSSAGSVSVPGGGTANILATGGPALSVSSTTISGLDFDTVSSTDSTSHGISLSGLGAGAFSAAASSTLDLAAGASGPAFNLNGGSGTVTFPGTINDGGGGSVSITNRTGGTVTMGGQINDTSDPGGGIIVSSNTGGATVFSNATKTLSTDASAAVVFNGGDGHTLTLSNGGLDIDTTSGRGIDALGLGLSVPRNELNITGSGNTIDTGAGKALEVTRTNVGATPLTFQRISSNGANGGIHLDGTGVNDALTVTGTAAAPCAPATTSNCTGGLIQNTTGADTSGSLPPGTGIVLRDTRGVSLTRMRLQNHQNYGIRGTNVTGLTIANSLIHGTNGTNNTTGIDDSSARFDNLLGTVSITDTEMSGGYNSNLMVENTSGTLNATVTGFTSGTLDSVGGDDAVNFLGRQTSTNNVTVQTSAIKTASGDLFQYLGDGSGGGTLTFQNNALTNNEPTVANGGGGVTIHGGARGSATLNVLNNTFRDGAFSALTIGKSFENTFTGNATANVSNNSIGVQGVPNSGANGGSGMVVDHLGAGNLTANITNNVIREYNSMGVRITVGGGIASSGQANFNISGNTIANPGTNPSVTLFNGLRVTSGVASGDNFTTCVNFGANSITGSSDSPTEDFRLAADHDSIRLPGYAGAFNNDAAVVAFVQSKIGGGAQGTAVSGAAGTSTAIGAPPDAGWLGGGSTCP